MPAFRLKRLFGRGKVVRKIVDIFAQTNKFAIYDSSGKKIYGDVQEENSRVELTRNDQSVGYIIGEGKIVLLGQAIQEVLDLELNKRELASEVLDRYRELNLLYDLAELMTDCHDVAGISELVLSQANKVAPSDGGVILWSNTAVGQLVQLSHFGTTIPQDLLQVLQQKIIARVLHTGKGELIDNLSADFSPENVVTESLLCVPFKSRSGVQGIMLLHNKRPSAYIAGTLKLVSSLAGQAAPAMESARLFDRQKKLSASFARFVPDPFLHALGQDSVINVRPGQFAKKEMSIYFSDIRSFTTLVEGKSSEENYRFINEYISYMEPCISQHNGFIDKYIGDAIMALFDDGGADRAVQAAIDSRRTLLEYNKYRAKNGEPPVDNGIGISTGPLMLGTIGSKERVSCSVIGDSVNTAARVESLTKFYRAGILISNLTLESLQDPTKYLLRPIDKVRVKGKRKTVTIYEVMDALDAEIIDLRLATKEDFIAGWKHYQQGEPGDALVAFASALKKDKNDRVTRLYLGRCWHLIENGMPDDWDGVANLGTK